MSCHFAPDMSLHTGITLVQTGVLVLLLSAAFVLILAIFISGLLGTLHMTGIGPLQGVALGLKTWAVGCGG